MQAWRDSKANALNSFFYRPRPFCIIRYWGIALYKDLVFNICNSGRVMFKFNTWKQYLRVCFYGLLMLA